MDKAAPQRVPYLDGFRAVSILLVLGFHGMGPVTTWVGATFAGWAGVEIFFVISGFLITGLLIREQQEFGSFSFKRFYIRRALRIFPAYYLFLAILFYVKGWEWRGAFAVAGCYLTNYDTVFGWNQIHGSGLIHTWSLAVEEQFYLLWPLTFYLCGKRAPIFAAVTIVVVALWRSVLFLHGESWEYIGSGFFTRLDCLMAGCLAAMLWSEPRPRAYLQKALGGGWTAAALALALFCSSQTLGHASDGNPLFWFLRYPLHAILIALFIVALCATPTSGVARALSIPVMVWIGRLSYSLYLWHGFIFQKTDWYLGRFVPSGPYHDLVMEGVRFLAVLAVASASYYIIECPFLSLKKYFEPRYGRRKVVAAGAVPPELRTGSAEGARRHVALAAEAAVPAGVDSKG
jgi:peptidoglycan/LPS O-acetylase OafA/YrhL